MWANEPPCSKLHIKYVFLLVLVIGLYFQSNEDIIAMESDELISKLVSCDFALAYKAAWELGKLKDPKTIKSLIKALEKDNLRLAASMAIVHYGQSVAGQIRSL